MKEILAERRDHARAFLKGARKCHSKKVDQTWMEAEDVKHELAMLTDDKVTDLNFSG